MSDARDFPVGTIFKMNSAGPFMVTSKHPLKVVDLREKFVLNENYYVNSEIIEEPVLKDDLVKKLKEKYGV